jgi:IS5 family transposase
MAMAKEIPGQQRIILGADKGYDRKEFVLQLREHQVTPHIARKPTSIIDARATRHSGYVISQQENKRIEEIFGWLETVARLRKTRHRGVARVRWIFTFALAVYNLVRMRNIAAVAKKTNPGHGSLQSTERALLGVHKSPIQLKPDPPRTK